MSVEETIVKVLIEGDHDLSRDKSILTKATPTGRETVAGKKAITIRIPDDAARSNRIELRARLHKVFAMSGNNPKDANLRESIDPLEAKEVATDLDGTEYRIYFKKSGKQVAPTEEDESLVCYALAARQKKGTKIAAQDLVGTFDTVHASKTLKECLQRLPDDWVVSAVDRANGLFKSKFCPQRNSHFHRGSPLVDSLGEVFKKVKKTYMDGKFQSVDINKWNPSDIWISNGDIKFNKDHYTELAQINSKLEETLNDRSFYGVSLKKSTGDVTYSHVPAQIEQPYTKGKVIVTKTKDQDFKSYQNIQVKFEIDYRGKDVEIQFRTFGGTSHQGNITKYAGQSTDAVHGKVGPYDNFIPQSIITQFKGQHTYIERKKLKDIQAAVKADKTKMALAYGSTMTEMLSVLTSQDPPDNWQNFGDFNPPKAADKENGFASKYMGLQIATMVHYMTIEQKSQFFSDVIAYASSRIPGLSSVYIKNK